MRQCTLVYLHDRKKERILLGYKKQGFGDKRYNGFGGKVKQDEGESVEDAAVRELYEESNVKISPKHMEKVGVFTFFFKDNPEWNQVVHVFFTRSWQGEPEETKEMMPEWFSINELPYSRMWPDDIFWLPKVIEGKKLEGEFTFNGEGKVESYRLKEKNIL